MDKPAWFTCLCGQSRSPQADLRLTCEICHSEVKYPVYVSHERPVDTFPNPYLTHHCSCGKMSSRYDPDQKCPFCSTGVVNPYD